MNVGFLILLIGIIANLGADIAHRKGKIKDLKSLFKVKMSALGVTIIGLIIAIYLY